MSKLGSHVTTGSRNGYGELCDSIQAVVIAVDEGGALLEAKLKSNGHTYTIFRDTTVYREAPGDINDPPGTYAQMASYWYPQLKIKWLQNPADYYTITNEQGGNDPQSIKNLIKYEREIMRLANADGFKVCILNLASGSPGDLNLWKELCVPFINEAGQSGNIYGRHAYSIGHKNIVPTDGNTSRPFTEAEHLRSIGVTTGLVVTELGFDGGYGYVGDWLFSTQSAAYDELMWKQENIIGACLWLLGNKPAFLNPNWETAIPEVSAWMFEHPTKKWEQGQAPTSSVEECIWRASEEAQVMTTNADAALQKKIYAIDYIPVGSETWITCGEVQYAIQPAEHLGGLPRKVAVAEVGKWDNIWFQEEGDIPGTPPPPSQSFDVTHWPTEYKVITQRFGANPQNYIQFGLPGHDGLDIRAPLNSKIFAAAAGTVFYVDDRIPGTNIQSNYGWHVRINHIDGFETIYAHLASDSFLPRYGQTIVGGQRIGTSGNTGNSTGAHLHFGMKKPPGDYGWPYNLINPEPYILPLLGTTPPPEPTPTEINLGDYFWPAGDDMFGRIYILKNNWGAGDERVQLQREGSFSYVTKNNQWEKRLVSPTFIDLIIDTSPSDSEYYTVSGHWLPRNMEVGKTFSRTEHVVFYDKDTCAEKAQFTWDSIIKFVDFHETWTNNSIVLNDVIELAWIVGGLVEETYYFAKHLGLVKWANRRGLESSIWELVPEGSQQNNQRGTWCGFS